jgi:hypothetical protein
VFPAAAVWRCGCTPNAKTNNCLPLLNVNFSKIDFLLFMFNCLHYSATPETAASTKEGIADGDGDPDLGILPQKWISHAVKFTYSV